MNNSVFARAASFVSSTLFTRPRARARFALLIGALTLTACGNNLQPSVVHVDGRAVEVVEAGAGEATVVFESGLGNDWTPWDNVASEVSRHARVFAYSRPGYGDSDPSATPRDAEHIVAELRALLSSQGYAPPYVLVGHSFGGTYMELFAKSHPDEVAGVVLVDPRPRDFLKSCEQKKIESCGISAEDLATLPAVQVAEYDAFPKASGEIHAAGSFGSYPVRVLTATEHPTSPAWETLWESMLGSLAAEAKDGKQVFFAGAGHYLQLERTADVARIIVEMLPQGGH